MIYMIERETLPLYALNWKTHARVHFHMDDKHPVGASQHQKIVVVDDAVAFSGGLDLSKWRWDTPEHASMTSAASILMANPIRRFTMYRCWSTVMQRLRWVNWRANAGSGQQARRSSSERRTLLMIPGRHRCNR